MPKLIEVNASASTGGKVQVRDYQISLDYHFSNSERWNVEDLTEEEAEKFRIERVSALKAQLEPLAQAEFDSLMDMREVLNED